MSVEVSPGTPVPEVEFAKYLTASLVKDAYFQLSPKTGALVRRDFGVVTVASVFFLHELTLERLDATLSQFLENVAQSPNKHTAMYTFLFIAADWTTQPTYITLIQSKQDEMDRAGVLADLVMIACNSCTFRTVENRKIGDKKLRKVLIAALQTWCHAPEERVRAEQETAQALKMRRNALAPQIEKSGPNPIFMLIFVNILIFTGGLILKTRTGTDWFVEWGIQDNRLILEGEVWRLFFSMFLHADLAHLSGNMLFLYMLGKSLYPYYKNSTLWWMYLTSGLVGNVAGLFFTNYLSLGASGAIMGLGGVLVYRMFTGEHAKAFRYLGNFVPLVTMTVYNLLYGLFTPGIDNYGHFGGFLGGILVAAVVGARERRKSE